MRGFDTPGKWSGGPFSVSNGVSGIRNWSGGPIPPRTPPHGPGAVVKHAGVVEAWGEWVKRRGFHTTDVCNQKRTERR